MLKVLLDGGHGAGRSHNRGGICYNEGDNNFHYSLVLKRELEKYENIQVDLTRNKINDNPSISARSNAGEGYDLFISIHSNAANGRARGTEVWDSVEKPNKTLAQAICDVTSKTFNHPNRGVKYRVGQPGYNWYGVLRHNKAKSSMIVENGFHDNAQDCNFFKNNHNLIAEVQSQAIAKHYNLKLKGAKKEESSSIKVNDRVTVKKTATHYATGQSMASFVKGSTYTVSRVQPDRVLLKEIVSWVKISDIEGTTSEPVKKKFGVGDRVKVKKTATHYATGQSMANFVKGSTYIISNIQSDRVLLKEIVSWVKKSDIEGMETSVPISNGLKVKTIRKYLSNVHIIEVPKDYVVDVDLGVRGKLETVSNIVNDKLKQGKKVLAGINLGFYNFNASSEHLGMLVDDGLYYSPPSSSFIDFIYYKNGESEIVNLSGYDATTLVRFQREAHWAIGASYSLVQNGKINLENTEKFSHSKNREPRTMFGIKADGSFVLVVVDGRSVSSRGMTAAQQAQVMLELGCYNAANADGGDSSTMVLVEGGKTKVVNSPSGKSERRVGSTLLVYEER